LGDYRQPEAVEKGTRDDRVAEVFDLVDILLALKNEDSFLPAAAHLQPL
jgi:hypothetical protein